MDDSEYEGHLSPLPQDYDDSDEELDSELEGLLYSSVHYASQLSAEQNLTDNHNDSLKNEEGQLKSAEKWHIDNADSGVKVHKYPSKRYYNVDANGPDIMCYYCYKNGHVARDCSKPKSCFLCGEIGHIRRCCPNDICYNCKQTGHKLKECKLRKTSVMDTKCSRCDLWGHKTKECTEIWRQYHYTTNSSRVVKPESELTIKTLRYCYNCASSKHFGAGCRERRYSKRAIHSQFIKNYSNYVKDSSKFNKISLTPKSSITKTKNVKSIVKIKDVVKADERYENEKSLNSCSSNFLYSKSDNINKDNNNNHPHKISKNVYQLNETETNMNNETSDEYVSKNRSNDRNNILKRVNSLIDNFSTHKESTEINKTICCQQSPVPVIISDDTDEFGDNQMILENNSVSSVNNVTDVVNQKETKHGITHCNTNSYTQDKNIGTRKVALKYSVLRDLGIDDDSCRKECEIKGKTRELNGSNEKGSLFGETVKLIKFNDLKEKGKTNPSPRYNVKSDLGVTRKQKHSSKARKSEVDNLKSLNKTARKGKSEKHTNTKLLKARQEPNLTNLELDHETLKNVYKILGDSSDENDNFDPSTILASVPLLTNINIDTNEEFECTYLEKSDTFTAPSYTKHKNHASSDGTHYNPTKLHPEDLAAYGMTSSGLITTSNHNLESGYIKCDNRKREKRQKSFQGNKSSQTITRKEEENVYCKKKRSEFRKKKRSEVFRKNKRFEKGILKRVIQNVETEKINGLCGSYI